MREYYLMVIKKENIQQLFQFAFHFEEGKEINQSSRNASIAVINAVAQWYQEKHKSSSKQADSGMNDEDDDMPN